MIFLVSSTRRHTSIAILALVMIALHLVVKYGFVIDDEPTARWFWTDFPLFVTLVVGGLPLIWELFNKLRQGAFGAIAREIIDVLAIANALRVAMLPRSLSDD